MTEIKRKKAGPIAEIPAYIEEQLHRNEAESTNTTALRPTRKQRSDEGL